MLSRCIRCGRETSELVEGRLCPQCYLEVYGLGKPPRKLEVTLCPRCGAYRYRGEWYEPGTGELEEVVQLVFAAEFKPSPAVARYTIGSIRVEKKPHQGLYASIEVRGLLRGASKEYSQEYLVPLVVKHVLCPRCLRKASGSPKAIVQVRSWSKRLSQEEKNLVEEVLETLRGDIADSIIGVEHVREGIDIKMADQGLARLLASKIKNRLGARVIESYKLIGRESNGKPKTRLTVSIRLPYFREGAVVDYNGRLGVVENIGRGKVRVRILGGGEKHLSVEEAWRQLSKPEVEEIGGGIVVAVEPEWIHIQLLDRDYKYLELPLDKTILEGSVHEGSSVEVYRYKGVDYVVGEEAQEYFSETQKRSESGSRG